MNFRIITNGEETDGYVINSPSKVSAEKLLEETGYENSTVRTVYFSEQIPAVFRNVILDEQTVVKIVKFVKNAEITKRKT